MLDGRFLRHDLSHESTLPREDSHCLLPHPVGSTALATRLGELERVLEHRTSALLNALRELAETRARLRRAEEGRKSILAAALRAATRDRLRLVERGELPADDPPVLLASLSAAQDCAPVRHRLHDLAVEVGMAENDAADLLVAAGEAMSNAVKHAGGGACSVYVASACVSVRVKDYGPGIPCELLPAAILSPGFSTAISFGMGFTLMLRLAHRIWLSTGPEGTVVQLDRWVHPPEEEISLPDLLAA